MDRRCKISLSSLVAVAFYTSSIGLVWVAFRDKTVIITYGSTKLNLISASKDNFVKNEKLAKNTILNWNGRDWEGFKLCQDIAKTEYLETTLRSSAGCSKIFVYPSKKNEYLSNNIYKNGIWERDMVELALSVLKKDASLDFLDLGSNLGTYALSAATLGRRVVAVEAFPSTQNLLCKSILANNFSNSIHLINNAISDSKKEMSFTFNSRSGKMNKNNFGSIEVKPSDTKSTFETVQTVKLDDLLDIFNFSNILMKIDVENHEAEALKGAYKFFKEVDVKIAFIEWDRKTEKEAIFIIDFMKEFNLFPHDLRTLSLLNATSLVNKKKNILNTLWIKSGYSVK